MCFLGGQEENIVWLDDYELKVKAYRIRSKYGDKIGTVFPELLSKGGGGGGGGAATHTPAPQQGYAPQQGVYGGHQAPAPQHQQPHHQAGGQAWGGAGQQQQHHPQQHQAPSQQQHEPPQQNQVSAFPVMRFAMSFGENLLQQIWTPSQTNIHCSCLSSSGPLQRLTAGRDGCKRSQELLEP